MNPADIQALLVIEQDESLAAAFRGNMNRNSALGNPQAITKSGAVKSLRETYGPDTDIQKAQEIYARAQSAWIAEGNEGVIPIDGAGAGRNILVHLINEMAGPQGFLELNKWMRRIVCCKGLLEWASGGSIVFHDLEAPVTTWFTISDLCFARQQGDVAAVHAAIDAMHAAGVFLEGTNVQDIHAAVPNFMIGGGIPGM